MSMPCLSILSPALSFYHHLNFHHLHANLGRYKCQNYPVTAVWIGELWRLVPPRGSANTYAPPHDELFFFKVQNYASNMFIVEKFKNYSHKPITYQTDILLCYIILLIYTSPLNIPTAHFSLSGSTLILFIYSRNKKTEKRGGEWRLGSDRR